MKKVIDFNNMNGNPQEVAPVSTNVSKDLVGLTDNALSDVRTDISNCKRMSMPLGQLATLGAGVASLLPAFESVTSASSAGGETLYRWVNQGAGDALKVAKNGNVWGAAKTADGASKMARFEAVSSAGASGATIPIDPVTVIIAVALFTVEQQLKNIQEMQKDILSFLETEKESEIEADVETISNIISQYKHNWNNEHFISSNHKMVIDIQRTARKHMVSYQKKVKDILKSKHIFVSQSKVKTLLDELQKSFKYYRLSLFAFSMSSLVEIMLSGNFKEENISAIKNEIEKLSFTYREIYGECSLYLEHIGKSSIETNVLKGVGATSKAVGKLIGSIPVIKDGQVDEFLQEKGEDVSNKVVTIEKETIKAFAQMSNPGTHLFTEKMQDLINIYNHTTDIYFDKNSIYLIAN